MGAGQGGHTLRPGHPLWLGPVKICFALEPLSCEDLLGWGGRGCMIYDGDRLLPDLLCDNIQLPEGA